MPDRAAQLARFLADAGVGHWHRAALPADASQRQYTRLELGDRTLIVMDAGAEPVAPFLRIAGHLRALGLAAPDSLAADTGAGLVLLEDLGPKTAAAHLAAAPEEAPAIYAAIAEALVRLQADPPDDLLRLDPQTGADMLAPLFDWYDDRAPRAEITAAMAEALVPLAADALSLRDLHAENVIWRPDRTGLARVGLLDFQDAWIAPGAYDLASLLDDPRRDVSLAAERAALARYTELTGADPGALAADRAVLSLQRNLRILGIFARLIRRDGKPRYRAFLPRLRRVLLRQAAHPALRRLRPGVDTLLAEDPPWL